MTIKEAMTLVLQDVGRGVDERTVRKLLIHRVSRSQKELDTLRQNYCFLIPGII